MSGVPADRCRIPQAFWRAVEQLGLQPSAVLRQARLPATLHLSKQQIVLTAEQFFAIWRALEALTGDCDFGIRLAQSSDVAGHQPLFLAACYAADCRDGIARIARLSGSPAPSVSRWRNGAEK